VQVLTLQRAARMKECFHNLCNATAVDTMVMTYFISLQTYSFKCINHNVDFHAVIAEQQDAFRYCEMKMIETGALQ